MRKSIPTNLSVATLTCGFLLIAPALAQPVQADGLIYQLPKDGASVKFDMELTNSRNGQDHATTGTLSVSSVGESTVAGTKCRWIEFKTVVKIGERERSDFIKVLVPEQHLGKGKSPRQHIVRAWIRQEDGEPMPVKDFEDPRAMALALYLADPPNKPGEIEKIEIDSKLGKLQCVGASGELEFKRRSGAVTFNFENRLHSKAPFGVVNCVWNFVERRDGEVFETSRMKLTLTDTGAAARSELPDSK